MSACRRAPFDQPVHAAQTILEHLRTEPDAVLAVEDHGLELARALLRAHAWGCPAMRWRRGSTCDKLAFRHLLQAHGFRCPDFRHVADDADAPALAQRLTYPVVVKARAACHPAAAWCARIMPRNWIKRHAPGERDSARADREGQELGLVVEAFIPGREYALEGLLTAGELTVLALFDKPDPLDGPYFEETIYVTPSRLPEAMQAQIAEQVARACRLAGLSTGPVHAGNARQRPRRVWLLEVASRSIGGLCGRVLRHALGMSLRSFCCAMH